MHTYINTKTILSNGNNLDSVLPSPLTLECNPHLESHYITLPAWIQQEKSAHIQSQNHHFIVC